MKVSGNFQQEVEIDPKEVIQKLMEKEIGVDSWVKEERSGDRYYYYKYQDLGSHRGKKVEKISRETFLYIQSLCFVLDFLNKKY